MKAQKNTEDYLKTIYILSARHPVHACMIADRLGVSRPTVSVSLKRLAREGYLRIDSRNVITLTEKGLETARPVFQRYQILANLLMSLGISEDAACRDACEMEHGLSDESFEALRLLGLRREQDGEDG